MNDCLSGLWFLFYGICIQIRWKAVYIPSEWWRGIIFKLSMQTCRRFINYPFAYKTLQWTTIKTLHSAKLYGKPSRTITINCETIVQFTGQQQCHKQYVTWQTLKYFNRFKFKQFHHSKNTALNGWKRTNLFLLDSKLATKDPFVKLITSLFNNRLQFIYVNPTQKWFVIIFTKIFYVRKYIYVQQCIHFFIHNII